jgi:hypothetical protein
MVGLLQPLSRAAVLILGLVLLAAVEAQSPSNSSLSTPSSTISLSISTATSVSNLVSGSLTVQVSSVFPVTYTYPLSHSSTTTPTPTAPASEASSPAQIRLDTKLDPGFGVLGAILILTGIPSAFLGHKNRWCASTFNYHVTDRVFIHSTLASQDFILPDWLLHSSTSVPRAYPQIWCVGPGAPTKHNPQRSLRSGMRCRRRCWWCHHHLLLEAVEVPHRRMGWLRTRPIRPMLPKWRTNTWDRLSLDHVHWLVRNQEPLSSNHPSTAHTARVPLQALVSLGSASALFQKFTTMCCSCLLVSSVPQRSCWGLTVLHPLISKR